HDLLGLGILAFCNALFSQLHAALAKAGDRRVVLGGGRQGVRQEVDRDPEFIMRAGEILRLKSELATLQGRLPLHDAGLAPRDLVLRDAADVLRAGGRDECNEEKGEKEERTGVGFGAHGGERGSLRCYGCRMPTSISSLGFWVLMITALSGWTVRSLY